MKQKLSKEIGELVEKILDEFDFEKVHKTMKALNWTWNSTDGVPTIGDLRRQARSLMQELIKHNHYSVGTGGLCAYQIADTIGLRFEVTSYEIEKEQV